METMHCVNPHDINPPSGVLIGPTTHSMPLVTGKIKLEMEEFRDLEPYLPDTTPRVISSSMDELNTPVFDEKGPFDFMVHENIQYVQPLATAEPFKFEYNNAIITTTSSATQSPSNLTAVYQNEGSEANNNNLIFATTSPSQANLCVISNNNNETPMEENSSANLFKLEDSNSVISANSNNEIYSNVSSPNDFYDTYGTTVVTPEDSNGSDKKSPKPNLSLALTNESTFIFNTLSTPDVIDDVVQLENNFNILDYVDAQDVTTVNLSDIYVEDPSTSYKPQRKRKPKHYDQDDEDYIPDEKLTKLDSSDSESDSGISSKRSSLTKRRRLSSRRTSSISSDHSDASKYRELRDKNNEASRRSRLKRKVKEQGLEKEADGLEERNIKLKAQVGELERVVNNFRSNLFRIMLKK